MIYFKFRIVGLCAMVAIVVDVRAAVTTSVQLILYLFIKITFRIERSRITVFYKVVDESLVSIDVPRTDVVNTFNTLSVKIDDVIRFIVLSYNISCD